MNLLTQRSTGWIALGLVAALIVWGLAMPWGLGLDFANFYDAGHKASVGDFASLYDPFAMIGGKEPLGHMTFFSAPIVSILLTPMSLLPPHLATFVFKLSGTLAVLAGLVLLYRGSRRLVGAGTEDANAFFVLFALAMLLFQPFWTIYRVGGQTTPFVFLLLVLGHAAYLRGADATTALLFSAVVLIKPALAPAAILLFFLSVARFRVTAIMTAICVSVVSLLAFGLELHTTFVARVLEESSALLPPWKNSSPFSWLVPLFVDPEDYRRAGSVPVLANAVTTGLRLVMALALLWTLRSHLKLPLAGPARRHAIYVTGLMLMLAVSPVVWAHYLMFLFVPLAFLIAGREQLPKAAVATFALSTLLALFQSLIVVQQFEKLLGFDSMLEIVAGGLVKSAPALIFLSGYVILRSEIGRLLNAPGWDCGSTDVR